ncbi:unnamed protein product [Litomosoides sigmodontis]|uniref:HMG box domain-containing protein n=1 Tax=Litomosoides sigmodontis TaxID=42156 RepID=A0A3P6V0N7_LITSI|nr:unnamed protein product [Litomosoides sigmodontis]
MEMSGPGDFVSDNITSGGAVCGTPVAPATEETSSSGTPAKKPKKACRARTGYMLFHGEARKRIRAAHPELNFVEVSKRVGEEWAKVSAEEKNKYKLRAEQIAKEAKEDDSQKIILPPPGRILVYQCMWQKCDIQADTSEALYEHIKTTHNMEYFSQGEKRYACLWSTCFRNKRYPRSFSLLPHLQQHIKYKHLPRCARFITPDKKSKNFFSLTSSALTPTTESTSSVRSYARKTHPLVTLHAPFVLPSSHGQMQIAPAFMIPQQQSSNFPQDGFAYTLSANTSAQSFADGGVTIAMLEQEGNKGPTNSEPSALQQAFYSGQQYLPNSNSAWTVPNKGTRSPEFNNG